MRLDDSRLISGVIQESSVPKLIRPKSVEKVLLSLDAKPVDKALKIIEFYEHQGFIIKYGIRETMRGDRYVVIESYSHENDEYTSDGSALNTKK